MATSFNVKQFILITLITSLWINVSEVFRYFVFVMPSLRQSLATLANVAPMNWGVFAIWGGWDTLLTGLVVFMVWLFSQQYGNNLRSALMAGTISWLFFFVLFWVGMVNMGLAEWSLLGIALPLSWVELVIASGIAAKLYKMEVLGEIS
ncbi:MAG: hypothetical protein KTR27_08825 [Leptolyngbyaceae cyanobacterium MAG.088]|nr:hypothetical protein [Leptolyngbyaceae cyanobacterium MAG.088]